jgi:putative DNA primase/helicase
MATSDQPQKAPNDEQTIKEILMSSTYLTHVDGPDPNCRISADRKTPPVPLDVIVFRNVMIDISKFAAGGVDFYTDKGPEKFVINVIDVDFDPAAQCPKFLAFLDQICNGDQEMMFALQLLLGLLLTRDTSLQSIFLFVGTPGSGKGTLLRIFTAVLGGTVNVVTALLSSLSGDFGASRFLGKTVGIFSDSHSGGKDPMKAIELLLTVSGEDDTSVDKKFEDARNGRLPIRFIVTMNELVSLQDRAGALHRRFIAFKFTRSFTKIAKGGLSDDIIKTELSGICNWALDGLKKLSAIRQEARACGESDVMAARHALQPSSGRVILEKMQELGTPIRLFVDEMCLVDQAKTVDANEIHYEYQSWCARAGLKPVSRTRFVQDITDAYPAVTEFRPGSDTGLRPRFLKGITLLRHVQPANSGPLSG